MIFTRQNGAWVPVVSDKSIKPIFRCFLSFRKALTWAGATTLKKSSIFKYFIFSRNFREKAFQRRVARPYTIKTRVSGLV